MKIDLNKLMEYKSLAYGASNMAQLEKVREEFKELLNEVRETSTFKVVKNRDNFIAEALDLITATVNMLLLSGLTDDDFNKHIAKLESYKVGKYKRQEDELKGYTSKDLDEALAHCKEKIKELCGDCKMQHEKLFAMLKDLKKMRIGKEWN